MQRTLVVTIEFPFVESSFKLTMSFSGFDVGEVFIPCVSWLAFKFNNNVEINILSQVTSF